MPPQTVARLPPAGTGQVGPGKPRSHPECRPNSVRVLSGGGPGLRERSEGGFEPERYPGVWGISRGVASITRASGPQRNAGGRCGAQERT